MADTNRRNINNASWGFLTMLLLLFLLFLPVWPYSAAWGYYPATGFGFIFGLFLIFLLVGAFAATERPSDRPAAR